MRTIRFRAWDEENKTMISGDSLAFEEYAPVSHLLSNCKNINQFTGLVDKNGNEIYENDIVKVPDWLIDPPDEPQIFSESTVVFREGSFCLDDEWRILNEFVASLCEVVGNVYE
jgi:uncharacterized phage protein (TIGR01671 family)